jgi:hypothetical protein
MEKYGDPALGQQTLCQCLSSLLRYVNIADKEAKCRRVVRRKVLENIQMEQNAMNGGGGGGVMGGGGGGGGVVGMSEVLLNKSSSAPPSSSNSAAVSPVRSESSDRFSFHSSHPSFNSSNNNNNSENNDNDHNLISRYSDETSRFLMRIRLFLRMFQLDSARTYTARLTTIVLNILEKFCKGSKSVSQFLGTVKDNSNDEERVLRRNSGSSTGGGGGGGGGLNRKGGGGTALAQLELDTGNDDDDININNNNIDNDKYDDKYDDYTQTGENVSDEYIPYGINDKILVSRKELLITLLLDTASDQNELLAATASRGGGLRQKGVVSAILLEIQKKVWVWLCVYYMIGYKKIKHFFFFLILIVPSFLGFVFF